MEFSSQICTTREQSDRLLALGLKKETADMVILEHPRKEGRYFYIAKEDANWDGFPAWSLHRLIEMLNYQVIHNGKKHEPVIAIDGMAYQDVYDKDPVVGWSGDFYTDVIDCIEWLITEGYFNKEYLDIH